MLDGKFEELSIGAHLWTIVQQLNDRPGIESRRHDHNSQIGSRPLQAIQQSQRDITLRWRSWNSSSTTALTPFKSGSESSRRVSTPSVINRSRVPWPATSSNRGSLRCHLVVRPFPTPPASLLDVLQCGAAQLQLLHHAKCNWRNRSVPVVLESSYQPRAGLRSRGSNGDSEKRQSRARSHPRGGQHSGSQFPIRTRPHRPVNEPRTVQVCERNSNHDKLSW